MDTAKTNNHLGFFQPSLLFGYIAKEFCRNFFLTLAAFVSIYLIIDFFEKIDRLLRAQIQLWYYRGIFLRQNVGGHQSSNACCRYPGRYYNFWASLPPQ